MGTVVVKIWYVDGDNEAGVMENCINDRNDNIEERIEQFIQDNEGEYCLLQLAHRALEAYGVY